MNNIKIAAEIVKVAKALMALSPYDREVKDAVQDLADKYMDEGGEIPKNEVKKTVLSIAKKHGKEFAEVESDFWSAYHDTDL